jgi:hypothetical protein
MVVAEAWTMKGTMLVWPGEAIEKRSALMMNSEVGVASLALTARPKPET